MKIGPDVLQSVSENKIDISSGWAFTSSDAYSIDYREILLQPISVEATTLDYLRFKDSVTDIVIRSGYDSNSPILWAGQSFNLPDTEETSNYHNNFGGLQGGAVGEYYHLSGTDYTKLTTNFNPTVRGLFTGTSPINYTSATGTISHATTGTAGTYTKVVTNATGHITSGGVLISSDIPNLSATYITTTQKGVANGVASLDSNAKVPLSQLPATTIVDTFVVASSAAQLALSAANQGDVCVRTDINKTYILKTDPYSVWGNWQEMLTPTDSVTSVFGRIGVITALSADYASFYAPIVHTHSQYLTSASSLNPSRVTQTSAFRFVTDTEKTTWNGKQNAITLGTTAQYFCGDLSLATFPTNLSSFTNGPGYVTSAIGDIRYAPFSHNQSWSTITSVPVASSSTSGVLTSTDWNTFNNKASTAQLSNYLPLSGGTLTGTLSGTTASFGNASLASYTLNGNYAWFGKNGENPTVGTNLAGMITGDGETYIGARAGKMVRLDVSGVDVVTIGGSLVSVYQPTLFSSSVTLANNTWNAIGDDFQFGDMNVGNTVGFRGVQNTNIGYIRFGTTSVATFGTLLNDFGWDGSKFTIGTNTVWHSGNLTNLNQLSNGPGYVTSAIGDLRYQPLENQRLSTTNEVVFSGLRLGYYPGSTAYSGIWASGLTKGNDNWSFLISPVGSTQINASDVINLQTTNAGTRDSRVTIGHTLTTFLTPISGSTATFSGILKASQSGLFQVQDYLGNTANDWVWFGYTGIHTSSSRYAGFMASKDGNVIASARYNSKGFLNAETNLNTSDNVCDWNIDRFHVYKNMTVAGTISAANQITTKTVFISNQTQSGDVAGSGSRIALIDSASNAKGWIIQHGSTNDKLQFFHQDTVGGWVEKAFITSAGNLFGTNATFSGGVSGGNTVLKNSSTNLGAFVGLKDTGTLATTEGIIFNDGGDSTMYCQSSPGFHSFYINGTNSVNINASGLTSLAISNQDIIQIGSGTTTLSAPVAGRIRMIHSDIMDSPEARVTYNNAGISIIVRAWFGMYTGATEGDLTTLSGGNSYRVSGSTGSYASRAFVEYSISSTKVMWLS